MILKEKNIVITGSGRGIGKYIALECAKQGANIGLTSRTFKELNKVKEEIENLNLGGKVSIQVANITNHQEVKEMFKNFYDKLGILNGVVANAGWRDMGPSLTYNINRFRKILDVNIMGVYFTFRYSFPFLKMDDKNDRARFIVTGSTQYPTGTPFYLPYTIAKYGVVGLIRSLSKEFKKDNITFNMVLPQRIDTKLTRRDDAEDGNKPDGFLNPWEISDYYIFLLSEHANKYNFKLLSTFDFETVKTIMRKATNDQKRNLEAFLEYLEKKNPKILNNVKDSKKFIEFLLSRY